MNDIILWSPGVTLEAIEEQVILKAFSHFHKNKTATSNSLGISIRTLDAKLEKYQLESKKREERELEDRKKRDEILGRLRGKPLSQNSPLEEDQEEKADEFEEGFQTTTFKTNPRRREKLQIG